MLTTIRLNNQAEEFNLPFLYNSSGNPSNRVQTLWTGLNTCLFQLISKCPDLCVTSNNRFRSVCRVDWSERIRPTNSVLRVGTMPQSRHVTMQSVCVYLDINMWILGAGSVEEFAGVSADFNRKQVSTRKLCYRKDDCAVRCTVWTPLIISCLLTESDYRVKLDGILFCSHIQSSQKNFMFPWE